MGRLLPLLILLGACWTAQAVSQELTLARIDWCPYNCRTEEQQGFVRDYLVWLFAKRGIELHTPYIPWTRALEEALNGKIDGLMTVGERDTHKLILPKTPIMKYQDCFYVQNKSPWQFNQLSDINNITIGGVQGYLYGDEVLSKYLIKYPKMLYVTGDNPDIRLMRMLEAGRIDAYIGDPVVHRWFERQEPFKLPLKQAGCSKPIGLFVALSPKLKNLAEVLSWLRKDLAAQENQAYLAEIKQRYFELNKSE